MDRLVQLLKFGLPLAPGVLATILLFQADQYLLQRYHNLETVGKYGFGYRFGAVLYYIVATLNTAWFPQLFHLDKKELPSVFNRVLQYVVFLSLSAFLLIDFGFRLFYTHFLPTPYWVSIPVISSIGLAYVVFNISSYVDSLFYYYKKSFAVTIVSAGGAAVNILLNILLIPHYSMSGAVAATFLSFCFCLALVILMLRKYLTFKIQWGGLIPLILSFSVIDVLSYAIKPGSIGGSLVLSAGLLACFFLMIWLFSGTMREEFKTVWGRLSVRS